MVQGQNLMIAVHLILCSVVAASAVYRAWKSTERTHLQVTLCLGLIGASYSYAIPAALWGDLAITPLLLGMEAGVAGLLWVSRAQWRFGSPPEVTRPHDFTGWFRP